MFHSLAMIRLTKYAHSLMTVTVTWRCDPNVFQGELDYETASMVKLYTTESINRNVTKAHFPIIYWSTGFSSWIPDIELFSTKSEFSKTDKSYCNYGEAGVTCGNTLLQKHSLVLVSKLFMLVLLKSCANLSQEAFILVELNKNSIFSWNFDMK